MIEAVGFYPGKWRLSTNQQGHINWSGEQGVKIAIDRGHILFWLGEDKCKIINATNFVGHREEVEESA
jgi:hypothetical protein